MKQRKLFVSLLVVMALVFALTGCFLKEEDTIEMVNAPKVDYTQIAEGEDEIHLKPLPFLPESRNPLEYFRLYTWLGGKNHTLMTRRQLIRFYQSAGFEPMRPSDITSEMQRQLA